MNTLMDYHREATRTMIEGTRNEKLANFCMGLSGECGEIVDAVKKHLFHGHELDKEDAVLELGDMLWYLTNLADELGYTLQEVAEKNKKKLRLRYPNGFTHKDSINRVDVK